MIFKYNNIILRDTREEDVEDYIRWETVETEWKNWDAPWENEKSSEEEVRTMVKRFVERGIQAEQENAVRRRFEVCINNEEQTHIGWVSRYHIDENFKYTRENERVTIGVDIPSIITRGKGYGHDALVGFMEYLRSNGIDEIYTQTWSGNIPMIRLAEKIGFVEYNRFVGIRTVGGKQYDALTFRYTRR